MSENRRNSTIWDTAAWRGYLGRYRSFRWPLMIAALFSVFQSLCLIPIVWLIKIGFDGIAAHRGFLALLEIVLGILVLVAASASFSLLARHLSLRITKIVIQEIRLELLRKSYALADCFAITTDRSWLHTAIVQDTERLDVGTSAIVVVAVPALVTSGIFLVGLAILAPLLMAATLVVVPLVLLCNLVLGRYLRRLVEQFGRDFETFDENIFSALRRMELTRLRGAESVEIARQTDHIDRLRRTSGRMAWIATAYSVAHSTITSIASLTTLLVGGTAVAAGWLTISGLAAYYFVLSQLGSSINALWNAVPQILSGMESLANISRTLAMPRRTVAGGGAAHDLRGRVELKDVHFRYGDEVIFRGVDLDIAAGESVALVGANGSGKTTLAYLMLGLYAPLNGQIHFDGVAVSGLDPDSLRRQIGVSLQDPLIFAGSIAENIGYGFPSASRAQIETAARHSGADAFIRSLPGGYDTVIGHSGIALSGGQCQLVALARALIGEPKFLILDEPTNHLDRAAVDNLIANLQMFPGRPTIMLITHDSELAPRMDRVFELAAGVLHEVTRDTRALRPQRLA